MGVPEVMEVKVNNFLDDFQVFLIILAVTGFPHLVKWCLCIIFMILHMISELTMYLCMYFTTMK